MHILGIDPSLTNTGFCVLDNEKTGPESVVEVGLIQTSEAMLEILRYETIAKKLAALIKKYKIVRCGSESPIFHAIQSENMFALYSFIKSMLFKKKVDVVYFAPMQLKKLARISSNTKVTKSDMIKSMKKKLGLEKAVINGVKIQGDIADAFHVSYFASNFWNLHDQKVEVSDLTKVEQEAFAARPYYKRGIKAGKPKVGEEGILYREYEHFYRFSDSKARRKSKDIKKAKKERKR